MREQSDGMLVILNVIQEVTINPDNKIRVYLRNGSILQVMLLSSDEATESRA